MPATKIKSDLEMGIGGKRNFIGSIAGPKKEKKKPQPIKDLDPKTKKALDDRLSIDPESGISIDPESSNNYLHKARIRNKAILEKINNRKGKQTPMITLCIKCGKTFELMFNYNTAPSNIICPMCKYDHNNISRLNRPFLRFIKFDVIETEDEKQKWIEYCMKGNGNKLETISTETHDF